MKKKYAVMIMAAVYTLCAAGGALAESESVITETGAAAEEYETGDVTADDAGVDVSPETAQPEGSVLNIYAWSEDFVNYFNTYYALPEGVTVRWTVVPKVQGRYQHAVDTALRRQDSVGADEKVDLFMADPDYMEKYVMSDVTMDIRELGITDFSNAYDYTVQACTDKNGVVKGAGVLLHPGVAVYRRKFAKQVLGTKDPEKVQEYVADWDSFMATAKKAAEDGFYMTPSYASTFLAYAQHVDQPWVDENGCVQLDEHLKAWMDQCETLMSMEATQAVGILDDDATEQALADVGKGLFFFGTDEYINGIMWKSQENRFRETTGDWRICKGPAGYSENDVYLMAATGTDNPVLVSDIIDTFLNNQEFCSNLAREKKVFTNNKTVNGSLAEDPELGNEFLGGQNPFSVYMEVAEECEYKKDSLYEHLLDEKLLSEMKACCEGETDRQGVIQKLITYIRRIYPTLDVTKLENP